MSASEFWPEPRPRRSGRLRGRARAPVLAPPPARARPAPPLRGRVDADLCIVGGGFTGLWAALHAKADDPARDVVVLEADTIGHGASGRNGGFLLGSLTHGIANGLARFGDEMAVLERLGRENLAGLRADLDRHGIDCDLELAGDLVALLEPYQDAWIEEEVALLRAYGHDVEVLDGPAMRDEVHSPTYRGGIWDRTDAGLVDPGRLVDGLREAPPSAGVRVFEGTRAEAARATRGRGRGRRAGGRVRARRVLLATSAFPPLLRAIRRYVVPVYDYALVTEPLDAAQREASAGAGARGSPTGPTSSTTTASRPTTGSCSAATTRSTASAARSARARRRRAPFARLSAHFFHTFPQLGACASPTAGAARSTPRAASRSSSAPRTAAASRTRSATPGSASARRGSARASRSTCSTGATPRRRACATSAPPVPFPPEPLRWAVVQLTRNRLAAADRNEGRRGLWLRTLDRLGLGFDS